MDFFIDTELGEEWFRQGKKRLSQELFRQVTDDGVHYERSISYHALVLEMYLISLIVAERVGQPFNKQERLQVVRMTEFLRNSIPPDTATTPQLGDADDGVVLRLGLYQQLYNHRGLLALAEHALGIYTESSHESQQQGDGTSLPRFLLYGIAELSERSQPQSRLYSEGGFASLRNKHFFLFADVGPIGLHGNNDTLSFTLHSSDGTAWFVDPGTGCYTRNASLRNQLRSTSAHNTPYIDDQEIARFAGLWRIESDRTETRVTTSNLDTATGITDAPYILEAEHQAYKLLSKGGITVQRRWEMKDERLEIEDKIVGSGSHNISVGFTLPEGIEVLQLDDTSLELRSNTPNANGYLQFTCSEKLTITESFYSPAYGILLPATRIEISVDREAPLKIAYLCRFISDYKE